MKAEHRKQLEKNELADRLGHTWQALTSESASSKLTIVLAVVLFAAVVILGWRYYARTTFEGRSAMWVAVDFATDLFSGDVARLRLALAEEAQYVLTAAGYTFADPESELTYDPAEAAVDLGYGPRSTRQSFERGVSNEVDYLNGEIVLLARLHGLRAPVNEAVQRALGRGGSPHVDEVLEGAFA